ncbi:hypothetical protein, partial [Celeribacter indicus]
MAEAGDVAGAQALILDELNRQYAGQAEALRNLPAGQIKAAGMAIGDATEKVGDVVLPVVAQIATHVEDLAVRFQALDPEMQKAIVTGGALAAAVGPLALGFGALVAAVGVIASPIGLAVAGFTALAGGVAYVALNWDRLVESWSGAEGIFGRLNFLVALPVIKLVELGRKTTAVIRQLGGFGKTMVFLSDLSGEVWERIGMLAAGFGARFEAIVGKVKAIWAQGVAYLAQKWAEFVGTIAPAFNAVAEKVGSDLRLDALGAASWASGLENAAANAGTLAANADLAADALIAVAKSPLATLERLNTTVGEVAETVEEDLGEAGALAVKETTEVTKDLEDVLNDAGSAGGSAGGKIASGLAEAIPVAERLADTIAEIGRQTFDRMGDNLAHALAGGNVASGVRGVWNDYVGGASDIFASTLRDAFTGGGFASIGASLSGAWGGMTTALSGLSSVSSLGALAELCLNLGDAHHQAARFSVSFVCSIPSVNLIPS